MVLFSLTVVGSVQGQLCLIYRLCWSPLGSSCQQDHSSSIQVSQGHLSQARQGTSSNNTEKHVGKGIIKKNRQTPATSRWRGGLCKNAKCTHAHQVPRDRSLPSSGKPAFNPVSHGVFIPLPLESPSTIGIKMQISRAPPPTTATHSGAWGIAFPLGFQVIRMHNKV